MEATLSIQQWLELPIAVRLKLQEVFQIPRSRGSSMISGAGQQRMESDGHSYDDLKVITVDKMQLFLGSSSTDYFSLFNQVVAQIQDDAKSSLDVNIQKVEQENIARWLVIIKGMKVQAQNLGLLSQFNELLTEFNEPIQTKKTQSPAPRGKKAATVS